MLPLTTMLSCGHPKECYYFHPALKGGLRHRCCACDDPQANTRAMQKLIEQGIIKCGEQENIVTY